ncbi:MAG: tryptophan synthase subunit alpha [Gammaproteobacteria bacterium]|nr:tryptophan synthase subunit alpha [Gammaproteobacteria bacterium]
MSRIQVTFDNLAKSNRKALIAYITAGDPHPDQTVQIMHTLVTAGSDIIELGVPFSDPMADGPVIQAACERALVHQTSLKQVLNMVAEFRQQDAQTPVVLMGYQNPIEVMGVEEFAQAAKQNQVDGVLTVDMPIEQAQQTVDKYKQYGLDNIFLIAPTTSVQRIKNICEHSSGFIYYVSLKGVTGAGHLDTAEVANKVAEIEQISSLPVGVGFGIKNAENASKVALIADAVVVGSAIIREIEAHASDQGIMLENIKTLLSGMRLAMDNATSNKQGNKEVA